MITTALISALAPAAVEAVKTLFGAISRKVGGLSVEDEIKLSNANVARLQALAQLDDPHGTPSQWVVDLRGSFRYIAVGLFIVGGLFTSIVATTPEIAALGLEVAVANSSFIIGERMVLSLQRGK
jgi:hypothetical protein